MPFFVLRHLYIKRPYQQDWFLLLISLFSFHPPYKLALICASYIYILRVLMRFVPLYPPLYKIQHLLSHSKSQSNTSTPHEWKGFWKNMAIMPYLIFCTKFRIKHSTKNVRFTIIHSNRLKKPVIFCIKHAFPLKIQHFYRNLLYRLGLKTIFS